jgi:hypothetical protein
MATVTLNWTTQDEVIPNAATFITYTSSILNADGSVNQTANDPLGTTSHVFLNVDPGTYMASVVLVDATGNQAAPPVTASFTVPTAPTAPVPVSVSVNLS